jgi:hypothetical protein
VRGGIASFGQAGRDRTGAGEIGSCTATGAGGGELLGHGVAVALGAGELLPGGGVMPVAVLGHGAVAGLAGRRWRPADQPWCTTGTPVVFFLFYFS